MTLTTDVVGALDDLSADVWDLVVLNFGSGAEAHPTDEACVDGILRYVQGGGAVLACHVVATAFPDDPRWEEILGGRWVRGSTMHPPQSDAEIRVLPLDHAVTHGLDDFVVYDERYSYLRVSPDVEVLATHQHDGLEHPVVWAKADGVSRGRLRRPRARWPVVRLRGPSASRPERGSVAARQPLSVSSYARAGSRLSLQGGPSWSIAGDFTVQDASRGAR